MRPRHQISRAAVELIKRFEGFRARAAQLDDGRWTIGYGHTVSARAGAEVSEPDAEALLLYDLIAVSHAVNEGSFAPLNQNQFDALVSFAFNLGLDNFRRSTTLTRLNEGRYLEAALAMELWRRSDFEGERIIIDALVRRRAAEKSLFLEPTDGWVPAPSPVLPPKIDMEVAPVALPESMPTLLNAPLEGERAFAERVIAAPFAPRSDDETTESERAAARVTARLAALAPVESYAPVNPKPSQVLAEVAPGVLFPPRPVEEDAAPVEPAAKDEAAPEPPITLDAPAAPTPRRLSALVLAAVAFVAMALFFVAVRFAFGSVPPKGPSGLQLTVGWGLGGLSIAVFAVAAYHLLLRWGEPREGA